MISLMQSMMENVALNIKEEVFLCVFHQTQEDSTRHVSNLKWQFIPRAVK